MNYILIKATVRKVSCYLMFKTEIAVLSGSFLDYIILKGEGFNFTVFILDFIRL